MEQAHLTASDTTIAAARSGDRDALGELWRIYQPQVLRFLLSRRCVAPDDVAANTWIDVGRALERFDGDGVDFQRWVFTIARRRSIDEIRRARRRNEESLSALGAPQFDPADRRDGDPADVAGSLDRAIALVRRLPENQAEAVMLRVVADMSVTDAAEVMGVSEANVRVLVHRGVTRLRKLATDSEKFEKSVTPAVAGT